MPASRSPPSPAWTISSSSSTASSPGTPVREVPVTPSKAAFTSPPLSPLSRLRRDRILTTARKRGWLTAPRGRQAMEAATTAFNLGTLPEVKYLEIPEAETNDEANLCDELNRILDFSDKEEEEGDDEQLKGASQWLESGKFEDGREKSAEQLLEYFDRQVLFGSLLSKKVGKAPAVTVKWSKRLYKTAGLTYMKRRAASGERSAVIELSTKVVDEPIRLYNTLAHEMCHAATWIIDDCAKPPHGAVFKSWTRKFSRWDPSLRITTCHDYDIRYKFNYECQNCGQNYGRHSRSINTSKQVCGRCKGTLALQKSRAAILK